MSTSIITPYLGFYQTYTEDKLVNLPLLTYIPRSYPQGFHLAQNPQIQAKSKQALKQMS